MTGPENDFSNSSEYDSLTLESVIKEYSTESHSPELITKTWQSLWKVWGNRAGLDISVPLLNKDRSEISEVEKSGNVFIFLPKEVETDEGRITLAKIFPHIAGTWRRNPGLQKNTYSNAGWIDIESSIASPNLGLTDTETIALFTSRQRKGQRLNTYIVGAQFSKLINGHYFDNLDTEGTESLLMGTRLMGSIVNGLGEEDPINDPVCVRFYEKGAFLGSEKSDRLSTAGPDQRSNARTGWRSEGIGT